MSSTTLFNMLFGIRMMTRAPNVRIKTNTLLSNFNDLGTNFRLRRKTKNMHQMTTIVLEEEGFLRSAKVLKKR